MVRSGPSVAILAMEGTNCDQELRVALAALGARPEIVHLKQFEGREVPKRDRRRLDDYSLLFLPGGFSGGDYVRAGAILAARTRAAIGPELEAFVRSGRTVGGICNGFQVAIELGLLPGRPGGRLGPAEAALVANDSGRFECRPTFVAWTGGRFPALRETPAGTRFLFPSGHGEGKFVLGADSAAKRAQLERSGQILFRWVAPDGGPPVYPWNPNGSEGDIAGITNPEGNVFGLMPHPERYFFRDQAPDWSRSGGPSGFGDGRTFLGAVLAHTARRG
ncbi:MAG TPA: phosphoribosylformylglycinamidine synthase I [Thermoplasmata archaeon]|nr:phosphoribosylformylglycinamidine synthase I [Thermoplasmata archaeon]